MVTCGEVIDGHIYGRVSLYGMEASSLQPAKLIEVSVSPNALLGDVIAVPSKGKILIELILLHHYYGSVGEPFNLDWALFDNILPLFANECSQG